jgi:hypothetical protein
MPCLGCREDDDGCCGCVPRFLRQRRGSQAQQPPSNPQRRQRTGQDPFLEEAVPLLQGALVSYTENSQRPWPQRRGDLESSTLFFSSPDYRTRRARLPRSSPPTPTGRTRPARYSPASQTGTARPTPDSPASQAGRNLPASRARILALLTQSPAPHFNPWVRVMLERTRDIFTPRIEHHDLIFSVETSFMIAPKFTTHESPGMATFVARLANGYNSQNPSPRLRANPRYGRVYFSSQSTVWQFSKPTPEVFMRPHVGYAGNHFPATIQNACQTPTNIVLQRKSH